MRFRAKLAVSCIDHFSRVVTTVSHMAKTCALRLTPNRLYFIFIDTASQGGVTVWCEVNQSSFFEEFRLEGKDEDNNIYLELYPDNLVKAMKSAQNAQRVKIQLTNKHHPCLTFEILLPSLVSHSRTVTHDVPVTVIHPREWDAYQQPQMPEYDVSIYMPSLKIVKNIVDRMKNLNSQLVISANMNGCLTLKVVTDMVSATTYFRKLEVADLGKDDSDHSSNSSKDMSEATVDIKKLSAFLHGQLASPTKVICNIVHQRAVQFHIIHDEFSLQYFIPAIVT